MRYDLAAMARRAGRRRSFALPAITSTRAQAQSLAAIYLKATSAWSAAVPTLMQAYERALAVQGRDGYSCGDCDVPEWLKGSDALVLGEGGASPLTLGTVGLNPTVAVADDATQAGATIDSIGASIERLLLTLTPSMRQWALQIERWHRGKWVGGALSAAGVNLDTVLGPQDMAPTVDAVIARNVALVRNVSDQIRGRIADIVFRGLTARTPARTVAREMNEAVGLGRKRSLRIASDQSVKITSALSTARRQQAGVSTWKWRWSHKLHGRPEHIARDGKIYSDDDAPQEAPGELPNCGCVEQSYIVID